MIHQVSNYSYSKWLIIAWANVLSRFSKETLSTFSYASKAGSIVNRPLEVNDPKQRLINEQKKQIDGLSQELNKAYTHIDSLYLLQGGEQMVPKRKNFIEISMVSKNSYSEDCKLLNKTSDSSKFKAFNEVDEEAIREALASQGDKSMLIEKLISVLKLAREVQSVNVQLR